jgi:NADPH:quinone reductase
VRPARRQSVVNDLETAMTAGVHAIRQHEFGPPEVLRYQEVPDPELGADQVGPGVDESWAGRRVVAHLGLASGGYAERAMAPIEALHTAVAILETAALRAEDVVLATAAAGGLGSLLIQAARNVGAVSVVLDGVVEVVTEIATLRGELFGPQVG